MCVPNVMAAYLSPEKGPGRSESPIMIVTNDLQGQQQQQPPHIRQRSVVTLEVPEEAITERSPILMDHKPTDDGDSSTLTTIIEEAAEAPYSVYSPRTKAFLVTLISGASFFSPMTSTICIPAITPIAKSLGVTLELIYVSITAYMIFQGLSPTLFGSVSDALGRRPLYFVCMVLYLAANVGCALAPTYPVLLVMRCFQACGCSPLIALGAGGLGDITEASERGTYIGIFNCASMLAATAGPLVGGGMTYTYGWRSLFWFLLVLAFIFLIFLCVFLPETCRSKVGNGSIHVKGSYLFRPLIDLRRKEERERPPDMSTIRAKKKPRILDPIMLLFNLDIFLILILTTLVYSAGIMVNVSLPVVFLNTYSMTEMQIGLGFLSLGLGNILGSLLSGKFLDWEFKSVQRQHNEQTGEQYHRRSGHLGHFPIEEARLKRVWILLLVFASAIIILGWTMEKGVNLSVPMIMLFFSMRLLVVVVD